MAKPEVYKGSDGKKIDCIKQYTVKATPADQYEVGKSYVVGPRTFAHLLRQRYNMRNDEGHYIGDGEFFTDPEAIAATRAAEAAATKLAEKQQAADRKAGGK